MQSNHLLKHLITEHSSKKRKRSEDNENTSNLDGNLEGFNKGRKKLLAKYKLSSRDQTICENGSLESRGLFATDARKDCDDELHNLKLGQWHHMVKS